MTVTVRQALNMTNVLGFDVSTTTQGLTAVVTPATIAPTGRSNLFKLNFYTKSGECQLFPGMEVPDLVASNAVSGQKVVTVTTDAKFAVGDYIFIRSDSSYANAEWGIIDTVTPAAHTITLHTNLTNTYNTADNAQLAVVPHAYSYIPSDAGSNVVVEGVQFPSLYVRRMSAVNTRVIGYSVLS